MMILRYSLSAIVTGSVACLIGLWVHLPVAAQEAQQAEETQQTQEAEEPQGPEVVFSRQIAPILLEHCVACHGPKNAEGGYRVDSLAELMKPGDSGDAPIEPRQPAASLLIQRVSHQDESQRMPPESEPLPAESVELLVRWIAAGADAGGVDPHQPLPSIIPPPSHPPPPQTYPPMPLAAVAFSPDGRLLFCGGYHELTVWDAADARLVHRITNLGQRIYDLAMSPDGQLLAVACGEPGRSGEVRLLSLPDGQVQAVVARSSDVVLAVAFRPGQDELAVASADCSIRLINYRTLEPLRTYSSHADWVTAIAFSDDGQRLASASRDRSAKVYDLQSAQLLVSYGGHAAPVRGVAFTADGSQVVSVGEDKKLHRWKVADGVRVAEVSLPGEGLRLVRGADWVLVPSASRQLFQIDLNTNQIRQTFDGHQDWVLSAAHSPTNGRLLSGGLDAEARLWTADGQLVHGWLAVPPSAPDQPENP